MTSNLLSKFIAWDVYFVPPKRVFIRSSQNCLFALQKYDRQLFIQVMSCCWRAYYQDIWGKNAKFLLNENSILLILMTCHISSTLILQIQLHYFSFYEFNNLFQIINLLRFSSKAYISFKIAVCLQTFLSKNQTSYQFNKPKTIEKLQQ